MKPCLLFDLDGTLIDSLTDLCDSINAALDGNGLPTRSRAQIKSFIGDGMDALVARSTGSNGREVNDQVMQDFKREYRKRCILTTGLYAGAERVLRQLERTYPMALVTNKNESFALQIIEALGVRRCFSLVIGGDSLSVRKPAAAVAYYCARRLNTTPSSLIIIGDHRVDMGMAHRARSQKIFCSFGIGRLGPYRADAHVRRFVDIPYALNRLHA